MKKKRTKHSYKHELLQANRIVRTGGRLVARNGHRSDPTAAGQNSNTTTNRMDDRGGFNYGWLGLLGLTGLVGLRRREAPDRLHATAGSRA